MRRHPARFRVLCPAFPARFFFVLTLFCVFCVTIPVWSGYTWGQRQTSSRHVMLQLGVLLKPKFDIGRLSRDPATTLATLHTVHCRTYITYLDPGRKPGLLLSPPGAHVPLCVCLRGATLVTRLTRLTRLGPDARLQVWYKALTSFPRVTRPRASCLLTRRARRPHDSQ